MSHRVAFTRRAERELEQLEKPVQAHILTALARLEGDPFSAASVKALADGGYRLRVGDYRILFEIVDDQLLVLVVKVGHRREVYRRR